MQITFYGAAAEVTGSCYLIEVAGQKILLDCGLIQGGRQEEARNDEPFPFDPREIDAVVLSHAHIDHSGRIPLLVRRGFEGAIYTQKATKALCRIMLRDAAFLNEKDAEWENRKRSRRGQEPVEPLYTLDDANEALRHFKGVPYDKIVSILPAIKIRFRDAGHILGSAIVEIWLEHEGVTRKLVFSGDLGHQGEPILRDPTLIAEADLVLMESTYGDRLHRPRTETLEELKGIFQAADRDRGNIIIPAFAVGRTQELLYLFGKHREDWGLQGWNIFLDSPMAIESTEVYSRHVELYDEEAGLLWRDRRLRNLLPNLHFCRTTNQSIGLNQIYSGAIIIAGSGMCTGGRVRHHLQNNIWRKSCHVIIVGFQAAGTTGRALVDGAKHIRLWGEEIRVAAQVHTVGGLSAHADQDGLVNWYRHFQGTPPLYLVHGEPEAIQRLQQRLRDELQAPVSIAQRGMKLDLITLRRDG